jgi:hypothetical protein
MADAVGTSAVAQFRVETRRAVLAVLDRRLGDDAFGGGGTVISPGQRALIADEIVAAITEAPPAEGGHRDRRR